MSDPVIQTSKLYLRDNRGGISGLEVALPAGPIGALVGFPLDGTSALASAIAGALRPHRGTLRIAGRDPSTSATLRRRIGVLLHEPELPEIGTVSALFALASKLRGGEAPREAWFAPLGMDALAKRAVSTLNRWERRTIALGLALAVPSPIVLALHDPLAEVTHGVADVLRQALRARAEAGACVLVLTPSTHDALALADDMATLERGHIGRAIGAPDVQKLTPGSPAESLVWCEMPRAFASALILEPEVTSLKWASSAGSPLQVHGTNTEGVARAVARVAVEQGLRVHALQPVVPSVSEVNAATAGMTLAMRQNAAYVANLDPRGRT